MDDRIRSLLLVALLAQAAAGPITAQSLGLSLRDGSRIGIAATGAEASRIEAHGDLTIQVPLNRPGGLSFELGFYGQFNRDRSAHETYGSFVWSSPAGSLSVGVLRPAYDSFAASELDLILPVLARNEARIGATRSRLTWGAMYDHYLPYGARWSAVTGPVTWAVSAHTVPNQNLSIGTAGISWSGEPWTIAAAVEAGSDGTTGGKLQLLGDLGEVTLGVTGFAAASPGFESTAEGFLTWKATDRLSLSALVQVPTAGGQELAVLAASYKTGRRGRATLGLSEFGGAPAASLGLDWTF
jgi:hypothetical protein